MTYEELLIQTTDRGLDVVERPFRSDRIKGLYVDGTIAINARMTATEKLCTLLEEVGHHDTAAGDILDQSLAENRKQERHGRAEAYRQAVPLTALIRACKHGCRTLYDTADYLGVTEAFLLDALAYYRERYGCRVRLGRYLIDFDPVCIRFLRKEKPAC